MTFLPDEHEVLPGSGYEKLLETTRRVRSEEYIELLADRLREVVDFGVAEEFLIRSLRDQITAWYRALADVGETTEKRAQIGHRLLAITEDSLRLADYRDELAKQDAGLGNIPLEEVAARIRDMVDRTTGEPDADEAAKRWAGLEVWLRDVEHWLPDDLIDAWANRNARRRKLASAADCSGWQ